MDAIVYRSLQTSDVDAVFAVARDAWQFTYATIFDPAFIDQFVRTNYAPERLRALVPLVEAHQMFFDVALDADQIIGFCNIGMTARGAKLFRIYLRLPYIGRGIGSTLLERGGLDESLPHAMEGLEVLLLDPFDRDKWLRHHGHRSSAT
jgi:hypothetical protein